MNINELIEARRSPELNVGREGHAAAVSFIKLIPRIWLRRVDSHYWPLDYESSALLTELLRDSIYVLILVGHEWVEHSLNDYESAILTIELMAH